MTDDLVAPALPAGKFRYLTDGVGDVQGWLFPATGLYLAGLEAAQRGRVEGGIAEIGVHRGKSFLAMAIDSPATDPLVAIDLFDDQEQNLDGTSVDALKDFRSLLATWGLEERVDVVSGSSLDLEGDGFCAEGPRFRLFSVDGGHHAEFVRNDMRVAEQTLVPGGIVAADDVFNIHWLGVCTGMFEYFHGGGTLRPFALVPNKLLLTDPAHVADNRALMADLYGAAATKRDVPLLDGTIDVYADLDWTLEGPDGARAPLQRERGTAADLEARLTGATLELDRVRLELRRAENHKTDLHRRLKEARDETRAAEKTARQARRAEQRQRTRAEELDRQLQDAARRRPAVEVLRDRLPGPLRRPARAVYRTFR